MRTSRSVTPARGLAGLLGAVLMTWTLPATAQPDDPVAWVLPDYAKVQTGGWLGLATIGLGWEIFNDTVNATAYYGYVPKSVGGTTIHSVTWNVSLRPMTVPLGEVSWEPVYVGLGAVYAFGRDFFLDTPERYPEDEYYPATGRRMLLSVGTEFRATTDTHFRSHGAFLEVTAVDHYLKLRREDREHVRWSAALSLSAGYRLAF